MKIVVVDDDREVREYLQAALEARGYQVTCAPNGLKLVSSLRVDRPDLILLDVVMTWIDGFELCRAIKQNEEFRAIPIVFVSGKTSPEDVATGLGAGASDYFGKPVELDRLLERVDELVRPAGIARPTSR